VNGRVMASTRSREANPEAVHVEILLRKELHVGGSEIRWINYTTAVWALWELRGSRISA
jgi:hypothetical protein